jgi:hypothetical protein
MKNMLHRLLSLGLVFVFAFAVVLGWDVFQAKGVTYTWDSGAGDGLWSSCTNWTTDTCPGASDIAQFDPGISDTSSIINALHAGSVAGINMMAGFTGTITQARTLTVGSSGFVMAGGTFTGATQTIDINGPLTLTAGTFTSTSGTLTLSGAMTVGASNTFAHNSGTFTFDGASDRNVDLDTTETFNNVTISTSAAADDIMILSGDTLVAIGTLTLTNGQLGSGTLEAQGATITKSSGWDGGAGVVLITQATVRNITWTSGPMSGLTLNAASTTITINNTGVFTYEGAVTVTSGTITNAGATSNTTFSSTFLVNGGTYIATPETTTLSGVTWGVTSGTFTAGTGLVLFSSSSAVTMSGSTTFYDFFRSGTTESASLLLPTSGTQTITHFATIGTRNPADTLGTRIPVESITSGVQANIDFAGQEGLYNVSLRDINNTGTTFNCASRCSNRGNNTGITFTRSIGTTVTDPLEHSSENGTNTSFTVVLDSEPYADVAIPITSTDTSEGTVSAATLTFTSANWDTPQTVTVTGIDDVTNDGAVSYTITVGAATSSDASYSGFNPRDVTVTNDDDDSATATIEFEDSSNFTFENVKDSTGVAITHFEYYDGGAGTLKASDGGAVVDITGSRIQPGCIITISGVDYVIRRVTDEATDGYNVTVQRDNLNFTAMDAEMSASLGVVTNIKCLEIESGVVKLNDDFINKERHAAGDTWSVYDVTNDKVWSVSSTTSLHSVVVSSGTTESFVGDGLTQEVEFDVTNNRIWTTSRTGDSVIAYNAVDGTYAFGGTIGASRFSVGVNPEPIEYDPDANAVWVGHDGSNSIIKLNASNGATIGTYAVGGIQAGIAYDTTRDLVWATVTDASLSYLVALNSADGSYRNGTLANSSYYFPISSSFSEIVYDASNDVLWALDEENSTAGFIHKIDPATGLPLGMYATGVTPLDLYYKSSADEVWIADSSSDSWTVIDADTGRNKATYMTSQCPTGITADSSGDIWGADCAFETQDRYVPNGVPTSYFYSIVTNDNGQIDLSDVLSIDDVVVTDTDNSQEIYYAFSFDDRHTFSIFSGGVKRDIASDESSVHGGVDGNWYYRNNASTWFAATTSSSEVALSEAVYGLDPEFTNNRMTSANLEAMTSGNWTTSGFSAGVTTTLDVAAVLRTTDVKATPTLQNMTFTLTTDGGGGGTPTISTTNFSVSTPACVGAVSVNVSIFASNASHYLLSESSSFQGTTWQTFIGNGETGVGTDGETIHTMIVPFSLSSEDGTKTIYAKVRSSNFNQSGTVSVEVELDQATACVAVPDPEPEPEPEPETPTEETPSETPGDTDSPTDTPTTDTSTPGPLAYIGCEGIPMPAISVADQERYRLGVSPMDGEYVPLSFIYPGDYMRSANFDTVYCITADMERRAFMDETTFFTQTRTFTPVKWVADETLAEFPLSFPMLPRQDVNFLKFESDPSIYHFIQDPLDPAHGILHWVTTEELAAFIAGENWADYVIDLNPTLVDRFDFSAPYITIDDILAADIDLTNFRERELLNEKSATATDPGIVSTLLEQGRALLEAAGNLIRNSFKQLRSSLRF